ncbi:MAG: hypothetical protein IIZ27_08785 [Solobacterium sp.]|nr:hypothetical protein [Solobacterium sp.]
MSTYVAITDKETENDSLKIDKYVQGCADFIRSCETPMSIAVQGDWGTGKSSFMRMVEKKIKDDVTVIRFDTWQYSRVNDDRLFLPMLNVLTEEIDKAWKGEHPGDEKFGKYFTGEGDGAIHIPNWARKISSLAGTVAGGGFVAGLAEVIRYFSEEGRGQEEDYYKTIVSIREKLQQRIDVLTGAKILSGNKLEDNKAGRQGRVVVFIDDLDRLRPASAVVLLEDMKNFMDCEGCVFVLALDHKLVETGVKDKYGDITKDSPYAHKFFEKIIQIPFYLPVNRYDTRSYIEDLLERGGLADKLNAEECTETVKAFTDSNPRVIKRALNTFRMNLYMNPEITSEECGRMFALLLLQSVDEEFFREITRILEADNSRKVYFEENVMTFPEEWKEKHPDTEKKWAYLGKLYKHDLFGLREDLFKSMVLESSHFHEAGDERDRVYNLICEYLEEKGMQKKNTDENRTLFVKGKAKIEVAKYINAGHANVNFKTLTEEKATEWIDRLEKEEKYCRREVGSEIHLFFDEKDEESYIAKGSKHIYVRKAYYDRRVFRVIGKLVNAALTNK